MDYITVNIGPVEIDTYFSVQHALLIAIVFAFDVAQNKRFFFLH